MAKVKLFKVCCLGPPSCLVVDRESKPRCVGSGSGCHSSTVTREMGGCQYLTYGVPVLRHLFTACLPTAPCDLWELIQILKMFVSQRSCLSRLKSRKRRINLRPLHVKNSVYIGAVYTLPVSKAV